MYTDTTQSLLFNYLTDEWAVQKPTLFFFNSYFELFFFFLDLWPWKKKRKRLPPGLWNKYVSYTVIIMLFYALMIYLSGSFYRMEGLYKTNNYIDFLKEKERLAAKQVNIFSNISLINKRSKLYVRSLIHTYIYTHTHTAK